ELASVEESAPRLWNRPLAGTKGREKTSASGAEARRLLESVGQQARVEDAWDFKPDERVRHEHFGLGKVVSVSGQGPAKRVRVHFFEFGEKNLVVQYARLAKVSS